MPPVPREQSAEYARLGQAATAARRQRQQHVVGPHGRHGDRNGDDDDSAAHRALPIFVTYTDLVAAGVIQNWTTLARLQRDQAFPPGCLIGNRRLWRADEVTRWLESRPSAPRINPEGAVHPRVALQRHLQSTQPIAGQTYADFLADAFGRWTLSRKERRSAVRRAIARLRDDNDTAAADALERAIAQTDQD